MSYYWNNSKHTFNSSNTTNDKKQKIKNKNFKQGEQKHD